jgi:hypothetical protein
MGLPNGNKNVARAMRALGDTLEAKKQQSACLVLIDMADITSEVLRHFFGSSEPGLLQASRAYGSSHPHSLSHTPLHPNHRAAPPPPPPPPPNPTPFPGTDASAGDVPAQGPRGEGPGASLRIQGGCRCSQRASRRI